MNRITKYVKPALLEKEWQVSFPVIILGKARTLSPNPGRKYHYKYQPSSFRTVEVQEEGDFEASREFLSSP
jgi:hypothetical protein